MLIKISLVYNEIYVTVCLNSWARVAKKETRLHDVDVPNSYSFIRDVSHECVSEIQGCS